MGAGAGWRGAAAFGLLGAFAAFAAGAAGAAGADRMAAAQAGGAACDASPPPVIEIRSANLYGQGDRRAAPDALALAERERLTADLNRFMNQVTQGASAPGTPGMASCALAALADWAEAGALLGAPASEAARKELIWNSAGLQLAYLRLRPAATPQQRARIEPWLRQLALRVQALYGQLSEHNNVLAWVALTQAAQAALSGRADDWQRAQQLRAAVLAEVDAEGWLRPELARGRRALAYHFFALAPLLAHQALWQAHGPGGQADTSGRSTLLRLLRASQRALTDPGARAALAALAGAAQDAPSERQRRAVAGLAACLLPEAAEPPGSRAGFERWLGGAVQGLCPPSPR